ncbi:MAG: hypothetical protein HYV27_24160 [Candidatus Hydrogenedentes bacterium]|nr:hypothetical protein [Candidatus Hydrogenedentota bacterium]
MRLCHNCHTPWDAGKPKPAPKDSCPACDAYLHCCLNCRHHRPSLHNQCYIPNTEWVGDRRGMNYCDEFEFRITKPGGQEDAQQQAARSSLEALLGADPTPGPPNSLDSLFSGGASTESRPKSLEDLFKEEE